MMRTLLILTLLAASLTACTSAPSTAPVTGTPETQSETPVGEPHPTGSAATATTAVALPIGVFTRSEDWTLEFRADGRDVFEQRGINKASGTYTVTGNQIVFRDGTGDCWPDAKEGTYTWAYDGNALGLKALRDQCGMREWVLTTSPWVKKP
jgi:heat shock protein HslJ